MCPALSRWSPLVPVRISVGSRLGNKVEAVENAIRDHARRRSRNESDEILRRPGSVGV